MSAADLRELAGQIRQWARLFEEGTDARRIGMKAADELEELLDERRDDQ